MPDNEQRLSNRTDPATLPWILGVAWIFLAAATPSMAVEDSLTVGSIPLAAPGDTVLVPIYVRDVSGTLLGGMWIVFSRASNVPGMLSTTWLKCDSKPFKS